MTQTGPSSGIGAHCPEAIGGCCRAFLLRAVVRRGGKLSYCSQFFSPPMKTVFAELSGDGYVKHIARRRSSSEVLALVRALSVSRWMNVRRGACEAQAIGPETQAPFLNLILGARIPMRVSLESLWAWIDISTIHALRRFLTTGGV